MRGVLTFPARKRNRSNETKRRFHISLAHDEVGPLSIAIPADPASNIRQAALWANNHPLEFTIDRLRAGFPHLGGQ
jgi:hypothetical protein